jgi:hypothetical protein
VHGVIFSSFRDFVTERYGHEAAETIFAGGASYLLSEAYPDEELIALVGRASEIEGEDVDTVVFEFGVFAARKTFARLYPAFFAISPSAREFLLTVETRIHELVRATIPNAQPPRLHVSEGNGGGLFIHYESPRRLCVLLRGLGGHAHLRADGLTTRSSPVRLVTPSASRRSRRSCADRRDTPRASRKRASRIEPSRSNSSSAAVRACS